MISICVCEVHQNVKLLVATIPSQMDYKDLLKNLFVVLKVENACCSCALHVLAKNTSNIFNRVV